MKANKGQIEKALSAPPPDIRFFLLYGPDEAASHALATRLERAMGPQADRVDLEPSALKADPALLTDEAASFSMFGDKRWIRVSNAGDESAAAVLALLEAEAAGNPVVAIGGALKATSKLVKLALDNSAAMAFISYQPDARESEQIAVQIARENGLRLGTDLARRIVELANGDRALMAGEIEKLTLYLDAAPDRPREATEEALNALAADNPEADAGPLVNAVLGGDIMALHREFSQLAATGTPTSAVLRPILTRAMIIAGLRAVVDKGGKVDAAVDAAGKAIFWKDKPRVNRQVRIWSAQGIERVLHRLLEAERASRSGRSISDLMVRHELLTIARQAARERA